MKTKHLQRILVIALTLAIVFGFVMPAHAAETVASGVCGENVTWRLDSDGVFTVSGSGPMRGYCTYSDETGASYTWYDSGADGPAPLVPWYDHLGEIRSAVIEPGVTSVSHGSFTFCGALESVSLPESLTEISSFAFAFCSALRGIDIPDSVREIGYGAFWECEKLQSIRIPAATRWIEPGALSGCTGLQRIDVSPENTAYRSEDGILFSADGAVLTQYPSGRRGAYVIPAGVKRYGGAFSGCPGLTKLTFTSPMEEYGSLECLPGLKECVLPEGMVRIPSRFFAECTALERVSIPKTVTSIGGQAFNDCAALQSIQLPEGLSVIEEWAFVDCSALKHINLPSTLTEIGGLAFCRCSSWCDEVVVPSGVRILPKWAFLGCDSLTSITLPDTLEEIGEWCFAHSSGLTTLAIPAGVKTIGENAFYECENLSWIILPSGLTAISEWMFGNDKKLDTVGIPRSVKQIDYYAFGGCWFLRDVYYEGTEAEWNQIKVDNTEQWNRYLLEANIHFNSDLSKMPKPQDRQEDRPTPPAPGKPVGGFADVFEGDYYADPVLWAVQHDPQITNGTSETTFSPAQPCTRAQMVTFLWRAAGCPEPKSAKNPFKDVKTKDYFCRAVLWAVEQGITNGTSETTFSPSAPVTRAQTVTFLYRAAGSPKVSGKNPFADVPGGRYYTDAVLWAAQNGITRGTDEKRFSPEATCTRAQIVTFLYRAQ